MRARHSEMRRRAWALAAVVCLLVTDGSGAVQPPASTARVPQVWGDLIVPGGAKELLVSAGIVSSIEEWRAVPAVIELFYGGLNPRIPRSFRSYGSREVKSADSSAPLPLGDGFWRRVLGDRQLPGGLLPSILSTRASASLYYGLLCMDTATLEAIQSDPGLASVLIRHGERLPVQARALRVRGGRIDPPGGDALSPFWTDLVGDVNRPADFVEALLTRDDGRLGNFYNTIDALPAAAVRFVAGPAPVSIEQRRERFRALYATFSSSMPTWEGRERRFFPIGGGPAAAIFKMAFDADGSLAGPPWLAFWERALAGARSAAGIDLERTADAADLLKLLCPDGRCSDERIRTLMFIQRQPNARSAASVEPLLAAARTRLRFPALALELERLRLEDLTIYGTAASVAERIDDVRGDHRRPALAQFQGAISLLRRLRETGLPAEDVRERFIALAALPVHRDGYRGGVLRWLVERMLNGASSDIDAAAVRALAGQSPAGALIEWEGVRYRVDVAATEAERIRAARARFRGQDLTSAWALLARGDRAAESAAADAITALVYSLTLQEGGTSLALSRELPQRHDFFTRVPGDLLPPSWTLPSVRLATGAVRHIGGSLLALESGVPELASRRLAADRPSERARISPVLADGLLRTAALTSLWTDSAGDGARVVAAAQQGASIARDPASLLPVLARAGIAGPRAGWIRWAVSRGQPDSSSVLRLEDLVRLAGFAPGPAGIGAAAAPLECLCLQFPSVSWEMRGQPPDHFLGAAQTVEVPLRVAYELATRKLPSVLAPGVLSLLASDLADASSLAHPADIHGIADTTRRMAATRFDDYIAAVAARGPLVPVSSGGTADR